MRVSFADFTLDSTTRQLSRGGADLHLSPKAFDLLVLLVAHRPGVVDKETIRDRLWPGTNVVDANLNNLASEIRSALDDDPQQPRFVRTVHRVGYAFCGVATEEGAASTRVFLVWADRRILLKDGSQILGRDPSCAVWIDAPGVSRRHARINVTHDGALSTAELEDLDSTNGTFVDGRPVRQPIALENAQKIRVGEAELTFHVWSESGAATKKIKRRS